MRSYIATLVLLLSSVACFAQNDDFYFIWIYDKVSQDPIEGVEISICHEYSNDVFASKITNLDGVVYFNVVFEPGVDYMVIINAEGSIQTFVPMSQASTSTSGNSYNEFYLHREGGS